MNWRGTTLTGLILTAAMAGAGAPAKADPGIDRALTRACDDGDRAACVSLGLSLADRGRLREDRVRALALLRPVCDAPASVREAAQVCGIVAELLLIEQAIGAPGADAALSGAYLTRACDMGSRPSCALLAGELDSGERLPPDPARARDLNARLCRSGEPSACDALAPSAVAAPASAERPARAIHAVRADHAPDQTRPLTEASNDAVETGQVRPPEDTARHLDDPGQRFQVRIRRINDGQSVPAGAANWVAMLWRPDRVALQGRMLCGGSLIAPGWVLTAAHCLEDEIGRVRVGSGHTVRLGVQNPFNENEGNTHVITGVFVHPSYLGRARSKALAWDIALISIAPTPRKRGQVQGRIAPVALDTLPLTEREIVLNTPATLFGWGRTAVDDPRTSNTLLKGQVYLQDRESCTAETFFTDIRRDSVLCAQERRGQHNCDGDSGGPMVLTGRTQAAPVLVGVISTANACGDGDTPSRFVRVAHPAVSAWLNLRLPPDVWRRITAPQR